MKNESKNWNMDEREDFELRLERWIQMDEVLNAMDMSEATDLEYVADDDEFDIEVGDADE